MRAVEFLSVIPIQYEACTGTGYTPTTGTPSNASCGYDIRSSWPVPQLPARFTRASSP